MAPSPRGPPAVPRPSSSVILISPENKVLLLHRVRSSSSFPSAHVFPGGNVSAFHDGDLPGEQDLSRHEDSEIYRMAAIRETFEESGILLARNNGFGRLIELSDDDRGQGRLLVHSSQVPFTKWLAGKGGRADMDGLIPFTRWITPTNMPKRFTTQMYLYFLPLSGSPSNAGPDGSSTGEVIVPDPTHDGGKEHTAAQFLPVSTWLQLVREDQIIMFPPQFFLLHLISSFLSPSDNHDERQTQRKRLLDFVRGGDPPWGDKVISPIALPPAHGGKRADGRVALSLDKAGPELVGKRRGEKDHVVLVEFKKEGPRRLEVRTRSSVLAENRRDDKL